MPDSVLEAIRMGIWDFEPKDKTTKTTHCPTKALPGSDEKLAVLSARVERGLPLWHPHDRLTYEDLTYEDSEPSR